MIASEIAMIRREREGVAGVGAEVVVTVSILGARFWAIAECALGELPA